MRGVKVNDKWRTLLTVCHNGLLYHKYAKQIFKYIINRATRRRKSIPISTFPVSSAALPTAQFL